MNRSPKSSDEPRRRHKRYVPLRSQVVCTLRGFWSTLGRRRNVALRLKDVSMGGAQIISKKPLAPGSRTDVTLQFPGFLHPVVAVADVRWCHRDTLSLEPRWTAGLTFKHLTPENDAHLKEVDQTFVG